MPEDTSIDGGNGGDAQTGTAGQQTLAEYLNALKAIYAAGAGAIDLLAYHYGIVLARRAPQLASQRADGL
jgi:hypothetical protein